MTPTTLSTVHANEVIVVEVALDPQGRANVTLGLVNQDRSDTFPGRTLSPDQADELAASLVLSAAAARASAGRAGAAYRGATCRHADGDQGGSPADRATRRHWGLTSTIRRRGCTPDRRAGRAPRSCRSPITTRSRHPRSSSSSPGSPRRSCRPYSPTNDSIATARRSARASSSCRPTLQRNDQPNLPRGCQSQGILADARRPEQLGAPRAMTIGLANRDLVGAIPRSARSARQPGRAALLLDPRATHRCSRPKTSHTGRAQRPAVRQRAPALATMRRQSGAFRAATDRPHARASGQPVDAVAAGEDDCSRDTWVTCSPRARDAVLWISRYRSTPEAVISATWPLRRSSRSANNEHAASTHPRLRVSATSAGAAGSDDR